MLCIFATHFPDSAFMHGFKEMYIFLIAIKKIKVTHFSFCNQILILEIS